MATMKPFLREALGALLKRQTASGGDATDSAYDREPIRRDQDLQRLRDLLLEGASSPVVGVADQAFFDGLRARLRMAD